MGKRRDHIHRSKNRGHYIDNRVATTISPGLNTTQLRPQTDQIQFFNSPPFPRSGFYETPLLDQLKYGDWDAPE